MFRAEEIELRMASPMAKETLPKRKGWFRFAWTKSPPAWKKGTKEAFMEKPERTMPSEMVGYMFTKEYVWAEPKEWLLNVNNAQEIDEGDVREGLTQRV